jgi:hypothetical protein
MENFYLVSIFFLFSRTRIGKLIFIVMFICGILVKSFNG